MHVRDESSRHQAQIDAALEQAAAARARRAQQLMNAPTEVAEQAPTSAPSGPPPGIDIPGYELAEELQRGGQGVVFRATQTRTGRPVAIKLMRDGPYAGAPERARFEREIRVLARLRHPYIVPIYDSGEASGWQYFVMDYIAGLPLDEFVAARGLTPRQTLILFVRVCDAVDAAHVRGVIHRDLKPANIRVDDSGVPHVLDFGLAKQPDSDEPDADRTLTGQFVGSLPWASPEQVSDDPGSVDMRSDVYSLGVILYRLLTGRHPYPLEGGVRAVIERISAFPPRNPSSLRRELDDELDTLVLKCLAKEPERRYQSAGELARDIRNYLTGRAIDAKRDSGWYVLRKQLRRHRFALLAAAAFVGLLLLSSLVAWSLYASAERARRAERDRLWDSYVAQARAGRSSERVGRRFDSLDAIRAAAQIRVAPELRDEAVACLALPDLRRERFFAGAREAAMTGLREPDRFMCLAGSGLVEVRAVSDQRVLATFEMPDGLVVRRNFSPDGEYLVLKYVFERDSCICIWEVATGRLVLRINAPLGGSFGECLFDPRGRWLAMINADQGITLIDHRDGRELRRILPGIRGEALAIDPNGTRIVMSDEARPLAAVWNLAAGLIEQQLEAEGRVYALAWSPDGRRLAMGCDNRKVLLWDMLAGGPPRELLGHRAPVVAVEFDRSGRRLASFGWDSLVRLWDVQRGEPLAAPLVGASLGGLTDRLALSEAEGLSVWEFFDAEVTWSRAAEEPPAREAAFSSDGARLLVSGDDGLFISSLAGGSDRYTLDARSARSPALAPDGQNAFAVVGRELRHWKLTWTNDSKCTASCRAIRVRGAASGVHVSRDGRLAVCAGTELQIYDLERDEVVQRVERGPGMIDPIFSPDGRHVFVGNWRGTRHQACLVDLSDGSVVRSFAGDHVVGAFSPSGDMLATCGRGETEIWDVAANRRVRRMERAPGQLAITPAFSPDGKLMAWARSNYEVHLLDARSGAVLLRLPNAELRMISRMMFSPDGERLLILSASAPAQVWEIRKLRRELAGLGLDW